MQSNEKVYVRILIAYLHSLGLYDNGNSYISISHVKIILINDNYYLDNVVNTKFYHHLPQCMKVSLKFDYSQAKSIPQVKTYNCIRQLTSSFYRSWMAATIVCIRYGTSK